MERKICRIGLFTKKENLTVAQFRDYWHYHHAAIASRMYGMMKYDQNHVVRNAELGAIPASARECDGMSQIWFESMKSQKSNDPETMNRLADDERLLFSTMDLVVCEQNVYRKMEPDTPYVKYMCFVKRKPSLTADEFKKRVNQLAPLFLAIPGCIEYREGLVVERLMDNVQGNIQKKSENEAHSHPSWISASYEEVPIDGVLEIYFRFSEDTAINNIFDTPEGVIACDTAAKFIEESSSFLCDVHSIVNKY